MEVMLAASGDMPDMISAGSVTKEPPPASAFCSPAHRPAAKIRRSISIGVASGGRAGDHDTNAPQAAGATVKSGKIVLQCLPHKRNKL